MGVAAAETRSLRISTLGMFLALALCYLAMSPGSIAGNGYISEEMDSGLRMMARFTAFFKGRPMPPMLWSRHGPTPVLFDIPFLKLGKFFFTPDWALSLEQPLLTAALMALVYLWLRKICSRATSTFLTVAGAFGTMLWPYAYLGLEAKQSFFVLLAGYTGLARGKIVGWPRVLLYAILCGFALNIKSTGVVLWPAIAYLMYVQFRDDWRERYGQLFASGAIVAAICAGNVVLRNFYWTPLGGSEANLKMWLIQSWFQFFTNVYGLLGSPAKGLFIFAPILVAALWAVPRAFRTHRDLAIFAALVFVCMMAFLSILVSPYDETWGPRFLHVVIAPLLLCIGAAWPTLKWHVYLPLGLLAILGVAISFLGSFFWYGGRKMASEHADQNTMEWLTSDNVWNEVTFDARLLRVWWHEGKDPVMWTPSHIWVWERPPEAPAWKEIDLRKYSDPQIFVFYYWNRDRNASEESLMRFYLFCLAAGILLMGRSIWRSMEGPRIAGSRPEASSKFRIAAGVVFAAVVVTAGVWIAAPSNVHAKLMVDKTEVVAGQGDYTLTIAEMPSENITVRYSLDGAAPEEMNALLDSNGAVHFNVGAETPRGVYRMLAFKRRQDVFWLNTDVAVTVK